MASKDKDKLKYSKQGREEIKAAAKGKGRPGKSGGGVATSISSQNQQTSSSVSSSSSSQFKSSRPSKGPGSKLAASSSDHQQQQHKQRTGFRIGRKPAPGVYTGKAEKIKASLIHNAKVKKQYAKMLQREGLGKGLSAGSTAARATREDGDDSMDVENSPDDTYEGDSVMQEEQAGPSRVRSKRPKRDPLAMQEDIVPPRPILSKRKSSEMQRHPDDMLDDDEEGAPPGSSSASAKPNHIHPDRRNDAKGKGRGSRAEVEQQPPQKRQRLTEDEIEEKRNDRKEKKRDWMKRGRTGQPMMGKRMDVLLGKIEKSVGKK